MGLNVQIVEQGWRRCLELGENLRGSGSGVSVVWVGEVGDNTAHWEASGNIPPQGVPQADGATT